MYACYEPHVAGVVQAPQDQWSWRHWSLQVLQQEPLLFVVTPLRYCLRCDSLIILDVFQKLKIKSFLEQIDGLRSNFCWHTLLIIEMSFTKDVFLLHFCFFLSTFVECKVWIIAPKEHAEAGKKKQVVEGWFSHGVFCWEQDCTSYPQDQTSVDTSWSGLMKVGLGKLITVMREKAIQTKIGVTKQERVSVYDSNYILDERNPLHGNLL